MATASISPLGWRASRSPGELRLAFSNSRYKCFVLEDGALSRISPQLDPLLRDLSDREMQILDHIDGCQPGTHAWWKQWASIIENQYSDIIDQ
jgi:hypothetical protein